MPWTSLGEIPALSKSLIYAFLGQKLIFEEMSAAMMGDIFRFLRKQPEDEKDPQNHRSQRMSNSLLFWASRMVPLFSLWFPLEKKG